VLPAPIPPDGRGFLAFTERAARPARRPTLTAPARAGLHHMWPDQPHRQNRRIYDQVCDGPQPALKVIKKLPPAAVERTKGMSQFVSNRRHRPPALVTRYASARGDPKAIGRPAAAKSRNAYATQNVFSPHTETGYTRPSPQGPFGFMGEFHCSNTLQGNRRLSCATASRARW
jgi:hypothetical protein